MRNHEWIFVTIATEQTKHTEWKKTCSDEVTGSTLEVTRYLGSLKTESQSTLGQVWEAGVRGSLISEVGAYGGARQLKPCLDQSGSTSQVRQDEHKDCAGMTSQTDDPDLCVPLTPQLPHADTGMEGAALIRTTRTRQVFCLFLARPELCFSAIPGSDKSDKAVTSVWTIWF